MNLTDIEEKSKKNYKIFETIWIRIGRWMVLW